MFDISTRKRCGIGQNIFENLQVRFMALDLNYTLMLLTYSKNI